MSLLKLSPRTDAKTHWSHLNIFLCGKRKAKSGEKLECRGVGGGSGEGGAGGS